MAYPTLKIVIIYRYGSNMKPLHEIIKSHRRLSGLSQAELAKLAGVGKTVVFDLEHGKLSVRYDTLTKVLSVLNISVNFDSPLMTRLAAERTNMSAEKTEDPGP